MFATSPSTQSALLTIFAAAAITGCARPPGPKAARHEPLDAQTASTLIIYRSDKGQVGAAVNFEVDVEGVLIGRLSSNQSLSLKVAAGPREIVVFPTLKVLGLSDKPNTRRVNAQPKQNCDVRFHVAIGNIASYAKIAVADSRTSLAAVTEDEWRARNWV